MYAKNQGGSPNKVSRYFKQIFRARSISGSRDFTLRLHLCVGYARVSAENPLEPPSFSSPDLRSFWPAPRTESSGRVRK